MKQLFSFVLIASVLAACNGGADKAAADAAVKQKTIDSFNTVVARQKAIDSMKLANERAVKKNAHIEAAGSNGDLSTTSSQAAKKKGWSHTAKGAVVGAGTGAVTGAIINHNDRAKGAVIGAVIGAGVGAGTGLIVDKSVKKKKKKASTSN